MKIVVDNIKMDVIITRKINNKNTYLRVKDDLGIHVTTNYFVSDKKIEKLINDNLISIKKMYDKQLKKIKQEESFFYLGCEYEVIYKDIDNIIIEDRKIFVKDKITLDKWLQKNAKKIFKEELDKIYSIFPLEIPYPKLTIRKMKTRWGVCNTRLKKVTLNFSLIKKDIKYLDYVISHELSHLVYPNHKKDFWGLVSKVIPNYKELRKELNNYE